MNYKSEQKNQGHDIRSTEPVEIILNVDKLLIKDSLPEKHKSVVVNEMKQESMKTVQETAMTCRQWIYRTPINTDIHHCFKSGNIPKS